MYTLDAPPIPSTKLYLHQQFEISFKPSRCYKEAYTFLLLVMVIQYTNSFFFAKNCQFGAHLLLKHAALLRLEAFHKARGSVKKVVAQLVNASFSL